MGRSGWGRAHWVPAKEARATVAGFLGVREAYPIPEPVRSEEEWQRYYHLDLPGMTSSELTRELARVRMRLLFDDAPHKWLRERRAAIERVRKAGR